MYGIGNLTKNYKRIMGEKMGDGMDVVRWIEAAKKKKQGDFDHYEAMAIDNGWTVPVNDYFADEVWVQYWQNMEAAKDGRIEGRPVAPHRSA